MNITPLTDEAADKLTQVLHFSRHFNYDHAHAVGVCRLALRLFDLTAPLHELGADARRDLAVAAVLHDCGKIIRKKDHHLLSQAVIMNAPSLPFSLKQRKQIGLIARYHRGAYPHSADKYFRNMGLESQKHIEILTGLLRLADGLGKERFAIRDLWGKVTATTIQLHLLTDSKKSSFALDRAFNRKKLHYCELQFNRQVTLDADFAAVQNLPPLELDELLSIAPGARMPAPKPKTSALRFPTTRRTGESTTLREHRQRTATRRRRLTG